MRVPVVSFLLAATLICGAAADAQTPAKQSSQPKKEKTNFFTADNGLGAAALGELGLTLGVMALSGPSQWYGYPHGDDGLPFANDNPASLKFGDCAATEGGAVAQALMAQKDVPQKPANPEGVLRLTETERQSAANAYDSKAMYQGSSCGSN